MDNKKLFTAINYTPGSTYPKQAPFDPDKSYPEFTGGLINNEMNSVYDAVRSVLAETGLDAENYGTQEWSPFRELVKRGSTIIIKPNLVLNTPDPNNQNTVTTHASIIRPIVDYCWKAMEGHGNIVIGDAPQAETDFNEVIKRNGIKDMTDILRDRGINVSVKDFRSIKVIIKNGIWVDEQENNPGCAEHIIINLGKQSLFYEEGSAKIKYHGGGYDSSVTMLHHNGEIHEYKVAKDILCADAVISIPKLKTHKKAGITCCLKNLVGINVDKNFLPHFIIGPANKGGDEMPPVKGPRLLAVTITRFLRDLLLDKHWKSTGKAVAFLLRLLYGRRAGEEANLARVASETISDTKVFQGAWQGNNTIWKMILDLNRIFLYADRYGKISADRPRNIFYIVDGIIAGDKNGPMEPNKINAGIIAAGANAFAVDTAILDFVEINWRQIPLYREAEKNVSWLMPEGPYKVKIRNNAQNGTDSPEIRFTPPDNWSY